MPYSIENLLVTCIFDIGTLFKSLVYTERIQVIRGISRIIKVKVRVISRSRRLRLITLTETLIIPDISKTESNKCFIIHCFEENNFSISCWADEANREAILTSLSVNLTLLLEIMHCARNLQIIH